jgi:hypothetical protein
VKQSFADLIKDCDLAMRSGHFGLAREKLEGLRPAKVPRAMRSPLAQLCRRAGLLKLGLRLLTPVAHSALGASQAAPSEIELAEYAVLLQRAGVVHEALATLARLEPARLPEVSLYRAYCHFNLWEYEKALPELERFIATRAPDYLRLVAQVNLAATHIALDANDKASIVVEEALRSAREGGNARLIANCLELRAQIHLSRSSYNAARADLELAKSVLDTAGTLDELFMRKWLAVIVSYETGSAEPLQEFRVLALARGDGDSVRQADRHLLDVEFSRGLFEHLVFGTPYEAYQQSIFQKFAQVPSSGVFVLNRGADTVLDTTTGQVALRAGAPGNGSLARVRLETGGQIHLVLHALFRDFYRPVNVGGLFSELFPDERFNIDSSPLRVQKAVQRTRDWLKESKLPLEIATEDGFYRPVLGSSLGIKVDLQRARPEWNKTQLTLLRSEFSGEAYFTAKEARTALGLSEAVFKRFAATLVTEGRLEQSGQSSSRLYRVKNAA